jgi:hypothetical protein
MHPYKTASPRSFWSKSVARNFNATQLCSFEAPLLRRGDKVVSAGSCFATNIVPFLERHGFHYIRTEERHRIFKSIPAESLGYPNFSAGYGNVYTPRQLLQLVRRCKEKFSPIEDRWLTDRGVVDPFRPGLRYPAASEREFELLRAQHFRAVLDAFRQCDVFILTLGLTECWTSKIDGAVFPACPGTVGGTFDSARHEFYNFSVHEVVNDLIAFASDLRSLAQSPRMILTVSPVPLVATATGDHVLLASTYSKSVLRVAAQEFCKLVSFASYFPSYEIVTGPQAPSSYLNDDRREVSSEAVEAVMSVFLAHCESGDFATGPQVAADGTHDSELVRRAMLNPEVCEETMVE